MSGNGSGSGSGSGGGGAMGWGYYIKDTAWDLLITYTTERVVLYKDWRIGGLHKACIACLACYLVFEILSSHQYMHKVSPATSVNAWVAGQDFLNGLERMDQNRIGLPWYCNNSATEYRYGPVFTYFDNLCDTKAVLGEIFHKESQAVGIVTYYQDQPLKRVGRGEPVNNFIPGVENITLFFSHGFTTSIGISDANVQTTVRSEKGDKPKNFAEGEPVSIQIAELLDMAGIDLDERHIDSGGEPPEHGRKWPLFRMTGVDITVEMRYKNFRSSSVFDFSNTLDATVTATEGVWTSLGQIMHSKWEGNSSDGQLIPYERYPQVIMFNFKASGEIGTPDPFTAIMNIAVGAAIFGVAKTIVDTSGNFLVRQFYDKKNLDHGDFLTVQKIKQKVWDEENEKMKSQRALEFDDEDKKSQAAA
eukprot:gb/GECG01007116.1/.p1 GENE.gb/GECG01007116.1/~~gb/GECG01007116.1/.p1  ORF type:complete len:418 (+),score=51.72 gb/GECG01007116.1/:1-1254(+)